MNRSVWLGGLCWCVYLVAMAASGDLSALLVPWQHHIVIVCGVVLAGLLVLAPRPTSGHLRDWGWVVHLLPLVLWLRVGSPELGGNGVEDRLLLGSGSADLPEAAAPPAKPLVYFPGSEPVENAPLIPAVPSELDLAAIYVRVPSGQAVITLGMFRRPSTNFQATLPLARWGLKDPLLLFRHRILCCAADAIPVTALLTGLDPAGIADDSWIEVTATVTWQTWEYNRIPVLAVSSWRQVAAPAAPFLYRWR